MDFCQDSGDHHGSVEFLLKQMFDILTECVAQPNESLSRLGCACIRLVKLLYSVYKHIHPRVNYYRFDCLMLQL